MRPVTRPSEIQINSIQEMFPEHLVHSSHIYLLRVYYTPELGKRGGGCSDEQGRHSSCPHGAHRLARKMETRELHKMRKDE